VILINDGLIDIVVCGEYALTRVHSNLPEQRQRNFPPDRCRPAPIVDGKVTLADFNGDGRLDILLSGSSTNTVTFRPCFSITVTGRLRI